MDEKKLTKEQILSVEEPRSVHLVGFINSWGKRTGEDGWQWVGEEYFQNRNIDDAWTLAWDYKPAQLKVMLNQVLSLLQELYKKLTNK